MAINGLVNPKSTKEVQRLTGIAKTLNRFIKFSPQTMSSEPTHRDEKSSAGTSLETKTTCEGPEVIKEPFQVVEVTTIGDITKGLEVNN